MIRKARMNDVPKIQKMLEISARKGELLPRPLGELYDSVRDFMVCTGKGYDLLGQEPAPKIKNQGLEALSAVIYC